MKRADGVGCGRLHHTSRGTHQLESRTRQHRPGLIVHDAGDRDPGSWRLRGGAEHGGKKQREQRLQGFRASGLWALAASIDHPIILAFRHDAAMNGL